MMICNQGGTRLYPLEKSVISQTGTAIMLYNESIGSTEVVATYQSEDLAKFAFKQLRTAIEFDKKIFKLPCYLPITEVDDGEE